MQSYGDNLLAKGIIAILLAITLALVVTPYYWAAPLPALASLVIMILARAPHWAYFLLVFSIPFGNYRALAGGNINIPWLLAGLMLLVVIIDLLTHRRSLGDARSNLWAPLILLLAVNLLSLLLSPYPQTAFKDTVLWFFAAIFIALPLFLLKPAELTRRLPNVLLVSIGLGAILAVLGSQFGLESLSAQKGEISRGLGGTRDPNNMGLMLLFSLPLLVHRLLYRPSVLVRCGYLTLIAITLLALASTYSRGAILMLIVCAVQLFWHYRHRFQIRSLGLLIATAALSCAIALAALPQSFWERQMSLFDSEDKSLSRRSSYLVVAWDSFLEAPLLGHGPGTFRERYAASDQAKQFSREGKSDRRFAHNSYLEVLVGTGLIGFVLYLAIQVIAVKNLLASETLWRQRRHHEMADLTASYRIMLITLLAYLTIFSDTHHKYWLLMLPVSVLMLRYAKEPS